MRGVDERFFTATAALGSGPGPSVEKIAEVFRSESAEAKRRLVEDLPPSSFTMTAIDAIDSDQEATTLEMLAQSFRFTDARLSARLALASHRICAERLRARNTAIAYTMGAPRSLSFAVNTLRDVGSGVVALPILDAGIEILDKHVPVTDLLLDRVELLIALGRVADAEVALDEMKPSTKRHSELRERVRRAQGSGTELPDARPFDERLHADRIASLGNMLGQLAGLLPPDVVEALQTRLAAEPRKPPEQQVADATTTLDTVEAALGIRTSALDSQAAVQKRLREAGLVLQQPPDPVRLQQALATVSAALVYADEHGLDEDAANARWIAAICHKRLGALDAAIDVLLELHRRLEGARLKLSTDPIKRVGVFEKFPQLTNVLCELAAQTGRLSVLIEAIESSKARILADVFQAQHGNQGAAHLTHAAIASATAALGAHYLTFYVDEGCVHAVLVTARQTTHATVVNIDRALLRRYANNVDPSTWGKKLGFFEHVPDDFVARFSPLVAWLSSLMTAGVLARGEHICYSGDDALHLFPLQLLEIEGAPVVEMFSLSRVHGAGGLLALAGSTPSRPPRFLSFETPARDDSADKAAALGRVGAWLANQLGGSRYENAAATLETFRSQNLAKTLLHFAAHGRFPPATARGIDLNPYTGSGLLLAEAGELPLRTYDWRAVLSPRVVVEELPARALEGSHVTLLACVSGLAREGRAGDALGLEWALMIRGAASVLSTHWNITAEDGAELVIAFYGRWLAGESRASAWRNTVNEMRASKPRTTWAAFSLCGDFR